MGAESRRWCWILQAASFVVVAASEWSAQPQKFNIDADDGKAHHSLYPAGGAVTPLVGDKGIAQVKADSDVMWIVEFYDENCPHCWYFSAEYPIIAAAFSGSKKVRFGAFNCADDANTNICTAYKVFSYPVILTFHLEDTDAVKKLGYGNLEIHDEQHPDIPISAKEIAKLIQHKSSDRAVPTNPKALEQGALQGGGKDDLVSPKGPPGKSGWPIEGYGTVATRFHDTHVGFASLLQGGYTSKDKYQAALQAVQFVKKVFGKDEMDIFDKLEKSLMEKKDLEPMEFRMKVQEWVMSFGSSLVFCKTTTCSVWQLLHGISALVDIGYAKIPVAEVFPMFRFLVNEFLSCTVCKNHFVKAYDDNTFGHKECLEKESEKEQAKCLMMWTWRTHNQVSVRVISEHPPTGKQAKIDRRFPAFKDCPGCWKYDVVHGLHEGKLITYEGAKDKSQPVYDVWNEEEVYNFLITDYLGEQYVQGKNSVEEAPSFQRSSSGALYSGLVLMVVAGLSAGLVVKRWQNGKVTMRSGCAHALDELEAQDLDDEALLGNE